MERLFDAELGPSLLRFGSIMYMLRRQGKDESYVEVKRKT